MPGGRSGAHAALTGVAVPNKKALLQQLAQMRLDAHIRQHAAEDDFADAPQLFVNPAECIDCGACVPVCPTNSIFTLDELPVESARFAELNAAHIVANALNLLGMEQNAAAAEAIAARA